MGKSEWQSREEAYEAFVAEFPPETLKTMPLDLYTNLNRDDSFCYWLETRTDCLGGIWGGSAYKFGIYKWENMPSRMGGRSSDNEYAWYTKYGGSAEEAFGNVRAIVDKIARRALAGEFEAIDGIDMGPAVKWKIAFLYADHKLVGIFNPEMLVAAAEVSGIENASSLPMSQLQRRLMEMKPYGMDVFEYGEYLWPRAKEYLESKRQYWVYSPGEGAYNREQDLANNTMAVGWSAVGNLTSFKNKKEIQHRLEAEYGSEKGQSTNAKSLYDFSRSIRIGDIVIAKQGVWNIVGIGVVKSDYRYDAELDEFPNVRNVDWYQTGEWLVKKQLPRKTLTMKDKSFYDQIIKQIKEHKIMANLDRPLMKLLTRKKQIVLQGAPGTGKTYSTAEIAVSICNPEFDGQNNRDAVMKEYRRLMADGRIGFTTFHQSMDYEEFVEGLKPVAENGGLVFRPQPGIFREMADKALLAAIKRDKQQINDTVNIDELLTSREKVDYKDDAPAYVLIIDEINRGNVSKILGELITLLEADKRLGEQNELTAVLPYSRRHFGVPSNLYIVATMNTADRSTGSVDYAIRRRFGFVTVEADRKVVEEFGYDSPKTKESALKLFDSVAALMDSVNTSFNRRDMMPGHSYFLAPTVDELKMKLTYELQPLLREYCNDGILDFFKDEKGEYAEIERLADIFA
ncbi:MAG: AAA family ATPase [Muribaculum sp.]